MNLSTAQIVFTCIATVEFLVWLVGYQFIRATARGTPPTRPDQTGFPEPDQNNRAPTFHFGSAEVEGNPQTLMETAANILIRDSAFSAGAVKITRRTEDTLAFESVGPAPGRGNRGFNSAVLHFSPGRGDRTRIDFAVDLSPVRRLLTLAVIINWICLVVWLVAGVLLYVFVVRNEHPPVRWQAIQMGQVVHLLWPPFLLVGLYRRLRSGVLAQMDAFVHNLPHYQKSPQV